MLEVIVEIVEVVGVVILRVVEVVLARIMVVIPTAVRVAGIARRCVIVVAVALVVIGGIIVFMIGRCATLAVVAEQPIKDKHITKETPKSHCNRVPSQPINGAIPCSTVTWLATLAMNS